MPDKTHTYVYGCLSLQPVAAINPTKLIYNGHKIEGWIMPKWLAKKSLVQKYFLLRKVNKLLSSTFSSTVA